MAIPSLAMIPSGYKDGKVYSVLPTNGDGDFTFSRGSSATRVNKDGLIETMPLELGDELITNGGFDTDSDWSKGAGWSISGGNAVAVTSGGFTALKQSGVLTSGKKYKITLYFDGSGITSGVFRISSTGISGTTLERELVDGANVFYLEANGTDFAINTSGANGTGSIDNISVKEVVSGFDTPRLDYSDSSCPSLLLEPQSTNLIPYSEDFSNAYFTKLDSSISSNNAISPDGSLNASKLVEGTSNGFHWMYSGVITVTNATTYSLSIFAKKGERNSIRISQKDGIAVIVNLEDKVFDTIGGSVLSSNITELINDWVRIEYSFQTTSTTDEVYIYAADNGNTNYQGDGTSGVYIWGAQLEEQSYPTSYIPTNGAISTRLQDECTGAGTSDTFNDSEGVLYMEIAASSDYSINRVINITDGTSSNKVSLKFDNSLNQIEYDITKDGVSQAAIDRTITDVTVYNKIACKWKVNDFALWVNGVEIGSDTSGDTPIGLSNLSFYDANGANDFYGKVKDLRVYNTALTDAELEELTQ